jgi:hypothetical protein
VGIPQAIIPLLREHLSIFVQAEPEALAFPGVMGGPPRRGSFNKMSARSYAVKSTGAEGLQFHDPRHTGNTFAASSGASLPDLMARPGQLVSGAAVPAAVAQSVSSPRTRRRMLPGVGRADDLSATVGVCLTRSSWLTAIR